MESYDAAKLLRSFRNLHLELCHLSPFSRLMLNWKKSFLLLGIKFRGHAKEEAKQQPATWMDFLTRKKLHQKFTSFIPSHIRKTAAGFLAINKAYY